MRFNKLFQFSVGEAAIALDHVVDREDTEEQEDLGVSLNISSANSIESFLFKSNAEAVVVLERLLEAAKDHQEGQS